jgi:aryl-alcohol dehydrogenase-like predicted oxidoreductase
MSISTIDGEPARTLGLAAYPEQDPQCIWLAHEAGINYFFFYDLSHDSYVTELKRLQLERRSHLILAAGSESRSTNGLRTALQQYLSALGTEMIDVFFVEYVHPGDDLAALFAPGGVLDALQEWKADDRIRYVGASSHDRGLAKQLASDARVDVLMHRYNMAHRKAADEVFPAAIETGTPVIAFTATRWATLLDPPPEWSGDAPTAVDCYRYCLAHPAVHVVLTAAKTSQELEENASALELSRMSRSEYDQWTRFGEIVYKHGGAEHGAFESRWP